MIEYSGDWGVIGHEWAVELLRRSIAHDRLRHAYLIGGPSGVGKTALAIGLARTVNCLSETIRPCGKCRACRLIAAHNHVDVTIISAEDKTLKIDQIREMQHTLALHPIEARYRVVILQRFHQANPQAADALLKTLEEPPSYVLLIVTAERIDAVPATIRSRCQPLALHPLPTATVRAELERRHVADGERATLLAQLSGGRLGWALEAAADESLLTDRTNALDALEMLLEQDRIGRFKYAEQLSAAAHKDKLPALLTLWQSYWRDVLLLISASHIGITNRDRKHTLAQLAAALHIEDAQRVLNAVQRTSNYLKQNVNTRLALEVLMLDLPHYKLLVAPP